jgi:serine phosphatase RsbU (regulator of sigma subunit)
MSVIASNLLNEVARMRSMTKVDDMLNYLDDRMRHILKQNDADPSRTGTLDGMDLAFCYYDLNSNVLQYAGAYRPLFMVRNGELYEYEATRTSIAGGGPMDAKREFEQNILEPQPGDAFYIFSDGFPDQFGGPNNRKFSKRQLKRTIESLAEQPMAEQQREIRRIFDEWKGEREQIDDVLLMGFRFQQ